MARCRKENSRIRLIMTEFDAARKEAPPPLRKQATQPSFAFSLFIGRVEVKSRQHSNLLPCFQRFTPCVQQRLNRLEILLLQFHVGRNRHRSEPVMPVRQRRRFLELLHRIRPPLRHLSQLRPVHSRLFNHLSLDRLLCYQQRSHRLLSPRFFTRHFPFVPVPQRQR